MNINCTLICALLLCSVRAFEIQDRFTLPPNEEINQLIVNDDHAYALIRSSNPATLYNIDLGSMKIINKLQMPNFMDPSHPIHDKAENNLYIIARNASSSTITKNLLTIDLNTFQVTSISIASFGCDQLFKAGPKFYCINQDQQTCTIVRIDAKTFTPEAEKQQYCQPDPRGTPPSLVTPDNQYAYLAYEIAPYIVSLANMTMQPLPYAPFQPYLNQKKSPANMQICATPDMTTLFMKGYEAASFVRVNVTSKSGNGRYYVEQGRSLTSCLVSPDSKYVFSGYSDGSIRRADALAPSFGNGYTGVLYQLDSSVLGMKILDDQRTVLVWTMHQMLKFDYNNNMQPDSPQRLALQQNFRNVVGMTVDREERFAYLYAYAPITTPNSLNYVIKYDLQQRTIVQVANTTGLIYTTSTAQIFLNAKQNRLLIITEYAHILNPDDLSVMYTNRNIYVGDSDVFQDPITSDIVIARPTGTLTYNIDTNTTIECNVSPPQWPQWKHLIRGPDNQVFFSTEENYPKMALVDRTTCATKNLNFTYAPVIYRGLGSYYNGQYYLLAYDWASKTNLLAYNLATGNFNQVANFPFFGIMSSQLSFEAGDSYVLLPALLIDGYIWKLNLRTNGMEQLRLYAPPTASYYSYKTNTAYILSNTEPPSIVKISV